MAKLFFTKDTFKDVIGGLSERIGWNMKCLRDDGKVERWRVKRHTNDDGNDFIEVGRYVINVPLIGMPVYPNNDTELDVLWHTITDELHLRPYVQNQKEMARLRYDYPKATERLTEKQAEKVATTATALRSGRNGKRMVKSKTKEDKNMNVKQSYFDFLAKHGAKQKVQAIIRKDIDEWKQQQAYYYEPDDNDPGDHSGHCHMMHDKTIGDIAKTDMEVLKAYTGDSQATYTSGCGLYWPRVADRISDDINDCLCSLRGEFIHENADALFEEYGVEREEDWTEKDIYEVLSEKMILEDYGLNYEWMTNEFPDYEVDDEEMPSCDYIFNVIDL